MALFHSKDSTGKWWIDHSLSLVIAAFFLIFTVAGIISGYQVYLAEKLPVDFWTWLTFELMMSWAAEPMGLLMVVLLGKFLYETRSPSSKNPKEAEENGE